MAACRVLFEYGVISSRSPVTLGWVVARMHEQLMRFVLRHADDSGKRRHGHFVRHGALVNLEHDWVQCHARIARGVESVVVWFDFVGCLEHAVDSADVGACCRVRVCGPERKRLCVVQIGFCRGYEPLYGREHIVCVRHWCKMREELLFYSIG